MVKPWRLSDISKQPSAQTVVSYLELRKLIIINVINELTFVDAVTLNTETLILN